MIILPPGSSSNQPLVTLFANQCQSEPVTFHGRELPPLWQQSAATGIFGGTMIAAKYMNADATSIIASDGFAQSLKNILKIADNQLLKGALLGSGTATGFLLDYVFSKLNLNSFQLGMMGLGVIVKIYDAEFNLILENKTEVNGKKEKIGRSVWTLAACVSLLAALAIGGSWASVTPIFIDATLGALSSSVKNLNRKGSPCVTWSVPPR